MSASFMEEMNVEGKWKSSTFVETITLDSFVKERGLDRVDFIKADIEGYERYMLMGARETLRKFAPKLVLCTYHLPDDAEVLSALIKEANPDYNIVLKHYKLFAAPLWRNNSEGAL